MQGQGDRPHGADPGHLRPARPEQGGQGAGRAGPAASTCCPGCAAGASRCPGRSAAGWRAAAASATRGPGETKIETDRRRIRDADGQAAPGDRRHDDRRARCKRGQRRRRQVPCGGHRRLHQRRQVQPAQPADRMPACWWTNSLFATLDPTVRRARTPSGRLFTLTDTVGFVRHLPHLLVEAFRSTLEEVDRGGPDPARGGRLRPGPRGPARRRARGAAGDRRAPRSRRSWCSTRPTRPTRTWSPACAAASRYSVLVSARTGEGIEGAAGRDRDRPAPPRGSRWTRWVPYGRGDLLARAHEEGEVIELRHGADGTLVQARVPMSLAAEFERVAGTAAGLETAPILRRVTAAGNKPDTERAVAGLAAQIHRSLMTWIGVNVRFLSATLFGFRPDSFTAIDCRRVTQRHDRSWPVRAPIRALLENSGSPFRAFGLYTLRALDYRGWTDRVARATAERRHVRRVYDSLHWMPRWCPPAGTIHGR